MELITPFLWFHEGAREAMEYYVSVFPDSSIDEVVGYPDENLDEHFKGMSGKVLSAWFTLGGRRFGCIDGGDSFTISEAVSFVVSCADQAEIDYYWQALSHVPEAERCGWCKDRFGVPWQIVPENMDELISSPAQVQAMMAMKKIDIAALRAAG